LFKFTDTGSTAVARYPLDTPRPRSIFSNLLLTLLAIKSFAHLFRFLALRGAVGSFSVPVFRFAMRADSRLGFRSGLPTFSALVALALPAGYLDFFRGH
jgi:hypothetical protein